MRLLLLMGGGGDKIMRSMISRTKESIIATVHVHTTHRDYPYLLLVIWHFLLYGFY